MAFLWKIYGLAVLRRQGTQSQALFNRFAELVRRCGPVVVSPSKTSVGFMVRVRFAGVVRVSERGMTVAFGLPRRLDRARIRPVEHPDPNWFVHYLRVTSPEQLDDELLGWLRESYKMMGEQGHSES